MIQMCVYNSILAGRLGDCWLAPGKLLPGPWEGCWLAPGKAGWPLGRLLLLATLGGCWLAPGKAAGCAELLIFTDFAVFRWSPSLGDDAGFLWVWSGYDLWHVSGYGVDTFCDSQFEEANMATSVQNVSFAGK